jgi:hypothetical protein
VPGTLTMVVVALAGGAMTLVAAGCGGSSVDKGGFTSKQRQSAQTVLDGLKETSVPITLYSLTETADLPPAACKLHLVSGNNYKLFVWWKPYQPRVQSVSYTWFTATLTPNTALDKFHVEFSSGLAPMKQAVAAHTPAGVLAKPVENCEILESGNVRLLPAT